MSSLTNAQLLLLDNLVYNDLRTPKAATVGEYINSLRKRDSNYIASPIKDEREKILDLIRNDPELSSLTIVKPTLSSETGQFMTGFVDSQGESIVIFRGTSSDYQWNDNADVLVEPDTVCQEEALRYINDLHEDYGFDNITVSGHSKGGNNAQYVTVLSPFVGRCLTYDGNGFSNAFMEKYKTEIEANKGKIISFSDENDVVTQLGNQLPCERIYIRTGYSGNDTHKQGGIIDANGNIKEPYYSEPGEVGKTIGLLNIALMNASEETIHALSSNAVQFFQKPYQFNSELIFQLVKYLLLNKVPYLNQVLTIFRILKIDYKAILDEFINNPFGMARDIYGTRKIRYDEQMYTDVKYELRKIANNVYELDKLFNQLVGSLRWNDVDKYKAGYIDLVKVSQNHRIDKIVDHIETTISEMKRIETKSIDEMVKVFGKMS